MLDLLTRKPLTPYLPYMKCLEEARINLVSITDTLIMNYLVEVKILNCNLIMIV